MVFCSCFVATYTAMGLSLIWGLFTEGKHNKSALINYIIEDLVYCVTTLLLLLMLLNINLDFRLRTQVMQDGKIAFLAIDKQGREVFRIIMKQMPKHRVVDNGQGLENLAAGCDSKDVPILNRWRLIEDNCSDDVTSDGGSAMTSSPMSASRVHVPEF